MLNWVVWSLLLVVGMGMQLQVFYRRHYIVKSWSVRKIQANLALRILLLSLWSWTSWTWFIEPQNFSLKWIDDIIAIGTGVAIALTIGYDANRKAWTRKGRSDNG